MAAKSVYFDDRIGNKAIAKATLEELKKWGRFTVVEDKNQADLIIVLSATPEIGGIIFSGGQTGTVKNGQIQPDPVPTFNKAAPVRYGYLTVIDPATGEKLWSDNHRSVYLLGLIALENG